ncbi:uncharacterized protein AMSG_08086 [Thecamonas trahens ATCC 50062]|uniref:SMP-LTD domain-containing protein n=1 Tax=Thecamonas trahens ATCC 50062 TaxID=461836 RepID=A0A0L0DJW5_THETB|nr:hypothetical protein AMSG_08086 [Thecamonas trahens ATCC 50062]KNC52520.1 hypothetical protein AMSG_08086 [Thecamonas trahens ATCC 50062]|eukprot:XP_013755313.1 hypothetical protein AMSG_08086 [Thecamonas trahens ATCC 50062]
MGWLTTLAATFVLGALTAVVGLLAALRYLLTTPIAGPAAEARRAERVAASDWSPEGHLRSLAGEAVIKAAEDMVFEGAIVAVPVGAPKLGGEAGSGATAGFKHGVLHNNMLVLFASSAKTAHQDVIRVDGAQIVMLPADATSISRQLSPKFPLRLVHPDRPIWGMDEAVDLYFVSAREKEAWMLALERAVALGDNACLALDAMFRTKARDHFGPWAARLESTDAVRPVAWFNALVGRMFWTAHYNAKMVAFFKRLIEKKIAKVKLPKMVEAIHVKHFEIGPNVPLLQWAKLLDVGPDGRIEVEGAFEYHGGVHIILEPVISVFTVEIPICISLRITRFSGHVLVHIAPPPSQRIWLGFYEQPDIAMEVDTVLGTAYNINIPDITDIIVDRIKAELVDPNNVLRNAVGGFDSDSSRAVLDLIHGRVSVPTDAGAPSAGAPVSSRLHTSHASVLAALGVDVEVALVSAPQSPAAPPSSTPSPTASSGDALGDSFVLVDGDGQGDASADVDIADTAAGSAPAVEAFDFSAIHAMMKASGGGAVESTEASTAARRPAAGTVTQRKPAAPVTATAATYTPAPIDAGASLASAAPPSSDEPSSPTSISGRAGLMGRKFAASTKSFGSKLKGRLKASAAAAAAKRDAQTP